MFALGSVVFVVRAGEDMKVGQLEENGLVIYRSMGGRKRLSRRKEGFKKVFKQRRCLALLRFVRAGSTVGDRRLAKIRA